MNTPELHSASALSAALPHPSEPEVVLPDTEAPRPPALHLQTSHVLAAGLIAFVFVYFDLGVQLAHTDIWIHLKYGQWIVAEQTLPERELFSPFSDAELTYANFRWLSQVALYLVYHTGELLAGGDEWQRAAGGVQMLRGFYGLMMALKFGLVLLSLWRACRSLPLAILGTMLLFCMTVEGSQVLRPQVFGEVLFAFLLWWMSGRQLSWVTWTVVPAALVLWANCHESFVVGLAFVAVYWVGRMSAQVMRVDCFLVPCTHGTKKQSEEHDRSAPQELAWLASPWYTFFAWRNTWLWQGAAAVLLGFLAVSQLNPDNTEVVNRFWDLGVVVDKLTLPDYQPLDYLQSYGEHWGYLTTLVLLAVSQAASPRALPLSRIVVLFIFAISAPALPPILAYWMMLVPWFLVVMWRDSLVVLRRALSKWIQVPIWRQVRRQPSWGKGVAVVSLTGISFLCWGCLHLLVGLEARPLAESATPATLWPLARQLKDGEGLPALAEAMKEYPRHQFQGRIFVQHDAADYLVWSLPAKAPVLMCSQTQLFPKTHWDRYRDVLAAKPAGERHPGWQQILGDFGVNLIVIDPNWHDKLAEQLRQDPDWRIVQDEDDSVGPSLWYGVAQVQLLIAVRSHPLPATMTTVGEARP